MDAEILVSFTLTGPDLDPAQISTATNLNPTKTWQKGTLIDPRLPLRYEKSGWRIASGCSNSVALKAQVDALLKRLSPAWQQLVDLGQRYGAEITCVIRIYGDERPPVHLNREAIKKIADLNASIDVDLYVLPEC